MGQGGGRCLRGLKPALILEVRLCGNRGKACRRQGSCQYPATHLPGKQSFCCPLCLVGSARAPGVGTETRAYQLHSELCLEKEGSRHTCNNLVWKGNHKIVSEQSRSPSIIFISSPVFKKTSNVYVYICVCLYVFKTMHRKCLKGYIPKYFQGLSIGSGTGYGA